MLRDCGKGYVYSVIVSFGVIVSFCFSVFIVKGIFGVHAFQEGTCIQVPGSFKRSNARPYRNSVAVNKHTKSFDLLNKTLNERTASEASASPDPAILKNIER